MKLSFKHYLVGGAVRDRLLGRDVTDRDWVVVGATPRQMKILGFKQVGRDFPVFLHPDTHEEYALARTERKIGSGHTGFKVHADADVSLEEDLARRDLTINAIAQAPDGEIIDPFGGVADLEAKVLKHVSDAFSEDPLRVFRVARLAAQLDGFSVDPSTMMLMHSMCEAKELETLSAERVWIELLKALQAPAPMRFFETLAQCAGLAYWFREIDMEALEFQDSTLELRRYVDLMSAGREASATEQRLKAPRAYRQSYADWCATHSTLQSWRTVDVAHLVDALVELKVTHGLERFERMLALLDDVESPERLRAMAQEFGQVKLGREELGREEIGRVKEGLSGKAYGDALRKCQEEWLAGQR